MRRFVVFLRVLVALCGCWPSMVSASITSDRDDMKAGKTQDCEIKLEGLGGGMMRFSVPADWVGAELKDSIFMIWRPVQGADLQALMAAEMPPGFPDLGAHPERVGSLEIAKKIFSAKIAGTTPISGKYQIRLGRPSLMGNYLFRSSDAKEQVATSSCVIKCGETSFAISYTLRLNKGEKTAEFMDRWDQGQKLFADILDTLRFEPAVQEKPTPSPWPEVKKPVEQKTSPKAEVLPQRSTAEKLGFFFGKYLFPAVVGILSLFALAFFISKVR